MSLRETEPNHYMIQVQAGKRRLTKRIKGTLQEAELAEAQLLDQLERETRIERHRELAQAGEPLPGETTTLRDYVTTRWLAYIHAHQNQAAQEATRTAMNYLLHYVGARTLAECGTQQTADIFVEAMRTTGGLRFAQSPWDRAKGPKPSGQPLGEKTIWGAVKKLKTVLLLAYKEGETARPPRIKIPEFDPSYVVTCPSDEQIIRFLAACETCRDKSPWLPELVRLFLDTGMRPKEIFALTRADADLERGVLVVRKTLAKRAHVRTVPMTRAVQEIVERLIAESPDGPADLLLPNSKGTPYIALSGGSRPGERGYDRALGLSGLRGIVTPVALRDAFAVRLLSRGIPLAVVSELLGDKDVPFTRKRYEKFITSDSQWIARAIENAGEKG